MIKWFKKFLIPKGMYCYTIEKIIVSFGDCRIRTKICPFWSKRLDKEHQESGYCSYLKEGDWESEHLSLLWDQVKECGVKLDDDEIENYTVLKRWFSKPKIKKVR